MKKGRVLDVVIDLYGLNASQLAKSAKIAPTTLSSFRSGRRDMSTSQLDKIIESMPEDAQKFFWELCQAKEIEQLERKAGKEFFNSRDFSLVSCG